MPRKIIIDCDPGIDDALALAMALFDPRLEVLAVTACSGTVDSERSTQNVQSLVEWLDPPRHPRLGSATDPDNAPIEGGQLLHGEDGLGNIGIQPVGRTHLMPSEKLIADQLKAHPGEITIVCLGPLTGVARTFQRDPSLVASVDRIVMAGGSMDGIGDVTATAEFNMHFDPASASAVFRSATTKTMIPLDVARQVAFGMELLDQLPPKYTRVGRLLHMILPIYFRSMRQNRAAETVSIPSLIALLAVTDAMLLQTQEHYVEVEEHGDLTRGTTIIDRRGFGPMRRNMEVAVGIDADSAREAMIHAFKFAGQCSEGA